MSNTNILKSVIQYWFHSENSGSSLWFSSGSEKKAIDNYIYEKYNYLLENLEYISPKIFVERHKDTEEILAAIIVLDQFSRHIYRNSELYFGKHGEDIVRVNTRIAIKYADYLITNDLFLHIKAGYTPFLLMPYKHENIFANFGKIKYVLSNYITMDNKDTIGNQNLLCKFYKDSLKKFTLSDNRLLPCYPDNRYSHEEQESVCEVYRSRLIKHLYPSKLTTICKNFLDKLESTIDTITISLSGGPDSMVLAHILTILCHESSVKINAFHLNYGNRKEADIEEEVICNFCAQLGLPLFVHKIHSLRRNNYDRNEYEKITREVRFKMYKKMGGNVLLGHIKEDIIENIWTNFANGRELFNLSKIEEQSCIDDVMIYRPFYMTNKTDIYEHARVHNISYLKNTTPNWSNRGKMRQEFLPAVEKQFGESVSEKIIYMSESLKSYKKILDNMVFGPFLESVTVIDCGLRVNIAAYTNQELHFWKYILTKLFHKLGVNMPSISSIKNFVTRLKNKKMGVINLKATTFTYIDSHNTLYIMEIDKLKETTNLQPNSRNWKLIKDYLVI